LENNEVQKKRTEFISYICSYIKEIHCPSHKLNISIESDQQNAQIKSHDLELGTDLIIIATLQSLEAPKLIAETLENSTAFMLYYQSPKIEEESLQKIEFVFVLDRSGSILSFLFQVSNTQVWLEQQLEMQVQLFIYLFEVFHQDVNSI
jgi:hypothetical protein